MVALVLFCFVAALCVYILWSPDWTFTHDSRKLLDAYVKDSKSLDYMHEDLALAADGFRARNDDKLSAQFNAFRWASILLGLSIVLWLIDLT